MSLTYLAPSWFYGWDVGLELAFAIISFVVAGLAFKIRRGTSEQSLGLLGWSFVCFGISYLIQSIFNFLTITKMSENVCQIVKIQSVLVFETLGIYAHILFMTIGLSLLLYMTFRTEKSRIFWILLLTSLLGVFLSTNPLNTFFLFSSLYLGFITWHFVKNYLTNRKPKTLLIAIAFLFLFFGSFHFLISVNHQLFYALGHILELIAYLLILANLYLVLR